MDMIDEKKPQEYEHKPLAVWEVGCSGRISIWPSSCPWPTCWTGINIYWIVLIIALHDIDLFQTVRIWDLFACTIDYEPTPITVLHDCHSDWITDCKWSNTGNFMVSQRLLSIWKSIKHCAKPHHKSWHIIRKIIFKHSSFA